MNVFAKEGALIIIGSVVVAAVLVLIARYLPTGSRPILWVVAVFVVAFTLYFFRDPKRQAPVEAVAGDAFVAPADGKIVLIQDVEEPDFFHGPARQVSIFLSPLNVHVNRVPATGVIESVAYIPGDYLVAWHPKASEKNERSVIGMRHADGWPILFKQIAGAVARRVVYHLRPGESVTAGQRFGIVKFGSRMDVLVPVESRLEVHVGDRVRAGETILGYLPSRVAPGAIPDSSGTSSSNP